MEVKEKGFEVISTKEGKPIKCWTKGLEVEPQAKVQLINTSKMPFIFKHLAVMPDVHLGKGSTVGSVIPTKGAIIPAAVGVDIGCGMVAVKTDLKADRLPDDLANIRKILESFIPVGQDSFKDEDLDYKHPSTRFNREAWKLLDKQYETLIKKHTVIETFTAPRLQLGTLGGGNHFIEILYDQENTIWFMLHSGSRGIGNRIGTHFINVAKKDMETHHISNLPDKDLAYLSEGTQHFKDYCEAVEWAQQYASLNRHVMMTTMIDILHKHLPPFSSTEMAINCHHNYISKENHFGENVWITRKGAVSAREGQLGIIPGSMGTGSFIVKGKGNPDSFNSCSHGAGRTMSRSKAKEVISLADHLEATKGVECRKDEGILDESPGAYKDLDAVMSAQHDLIDVLFRLRPVLCIKG